MKFTSKIWILIILAILSFLSLFLNLNPMSVTFLQDGVLVKSVELDSQLYSDGLRKGMVILSVNGLIVNNLEEFSEAIAPYSELKENETIRTEIEVMDLENSIVNLYGSEIVNELRVGEVPKSKLNTGLDLQGGARAFVKVKGDVSESESEDVIAVLEERLNAYGLTDVEIYKVRSSGETLIGIEIAGSSPSELESLIEEQGKFEAKIANQTIFVGGDKDITHVSRTGENAVVYNCRDTSDGAICEFRFQISLSTHAADKFADVTSNISTVNNCNPKVTQEGCYLTEDIVFFIDGVNVSSLRISASLKGRPETSISITGAETGTSQQEAYDNTKIEMNRLQTILITGSLPHELEIVKIDVISPNLGEQFSKQILIAGLFAILAITLFTFVRYKKPKISLAIVLVSFSEVLIILGIASLINWNLDLPSIAGIIATIGVGIDSQIIILDESRIKGESLKQRIKKSLFIITTAFTTTLLALLPLTGLLGFLGIGAASAGMLKGFAITTIIGSLVGVLISRPAFADISRQLQDKEE